MSMLRLRPTGPQWPYSVALLRADEPRLSVSSNPHPGELDSYAALDPPILLYVVSEVSPPAINPRLQRLLPVQVELVDNEWRQVWSVRDATEEETAEYDAANQPQPSWVDFGAAVQISPAINQLIAAALQQLPGLGLGLAVGLGKVEDGRPANFLKSWGIAKQLNLITPQLVTEVTALAQQFDLPADFVAALGPSEN
jgi:hypothetical protein